MLNLFLDKTYIRYYLAVVVSHIGDGITRTVIIYLIAKLTDDPLMISIALFAQLAPTAILALFTGALADRFSRRWIMIYADVFRLIVVVLMMFAQDSIVLLLSLVVLVGIGTAFFEPARISSVPAIVGRDRIPQAVALFQGTLSAVHFIAPALAGVLIASSNITITFMIDGITYLCSAILFYSLFVLKEEQTETIIHKHYLASIKEGLLEFFTHSVLKNLLLFLVPIMVVLGIFVAGYKTLLLEHYQVSALHFGFLEGIFGGGAIIGAFTGPKIMNKVSPMRMVIGACSALGVLMIIVLFLDTIMLNFLLIPLYMWCAFIGIIYAFINFPLANLFLTLAPKHLLGRGMSIFQATITTWMIVGTLLGGWIGTTYGVITSLSIGGVFIILVCIMITWKNTIEIGNTKAIS